MHHVVIVGGGFGGLQAARYLRKSPVQVILVDRRNHHLFQPLLYQVATGALSPANIAAPLRKVLRRQRNTQVLLGEVVQIDVASRLVLLRDGKSLPFDTLILAAGSTHSYFGHDEWEAQATGLKSIEDATAIRRRILLAFEEAEKSNDPQMVTELLTFVVVGGGPTGVELAGAIGEIAKDTLRHEFRTINPADAIVLLIELGERILPSYPPELSKKAAEGLRQLGAVVRTNTQVAGVEPGAVVLRHQGQEERLATRNIFWAAGVKASPLAELVARATGASTDRMGRVHVGRDLSLPGHPEIFVIGDMAHYPFNDKDQKPLPAVAPVAMQQATYVARSIHSRATNGPPPEPFRYADYGSMATIGRRQAIVDIRGWHFSGTFAWLMWLFVHLLQLVQFESRVLVLIQWAWYYVTRNRGARLITGEDKAAGPIRELEKSFADDEAAMTERTLAAKHSQ